MSEWESFYVIVGSSAAALIGIQFVVITLVASIRTLATASSIGAFGTPTVVHLTSALIVSAVMSAPWGTAISPSIALAICGVGGLTYCAVVIRRARRQTTYEPVWEDWLWHALLPCASYGVLALTVLFGSAATERGGFFVAGVTLALLLIGIHNAWDTVTYVAVSSRE